MLSYDQRNNFTIKCEMNGAALIDRWVGKHSEMLLTGGQNKRGGLEFEKRL